MVTEMKEIAQFILQKFRVWGTIQKSEFV